MQGGLVMEQQLQQFIQFLQQNKEAAIAAAVVGGIIVLLILRSILKLLWKIVSFPFKMLFGTESASKEVSQLHRSKNWGGKPHVDLYDRDKSGKVISQDHGHSPTLYPPPREEGRIKIRKKKDLPPPYGKID